MNARARWTADYREARKLARFIETFHDKLETLPPGQRTMPGLRGFSFTRLHGDHLRWFGDGCFPPPIECHRSRLAVVRCEYPRPRLPA